MPNLNNSGVNWRYDSGSEEMPAWRDDRASRSHGARNSLEPGPDLPPRPSTCGSNGGGKPDCGCGTNSAERAATGPDIRYAPPQPPTDHEGASLARLGKPDIRYAPPQPPTDHEGASLARLGKPDIRYAPPQPPTDHEGASLARLRMPDIREAGETGDERWTLTGRERRSLRIRRAEPEHPYRLDVRYVLTAPDLWSAPVHRMGYLDALRTGLLPQFNVAGSNPCTTLAPERIAALLPELPKGVESSREPRRELRTTAFERAGELVQATADIHFTRWDNGPLGRSRLLGAACNTRYLFAALYYWNEDYEVRNPPDGLSDDQLRRDYSRSGKSTARAAAQKPTKANTAAREVTRQLVQAAEAHCGTLIAPPCQSYIELDRYTIVESESTFKTEDQLQERNGELVLVDSYRHGVLVLLEFMCCPGEGVFEVKLYANETARFPLRMIEIPCCKPWLRAAAQHDYQPTDVTDDILGQELRKVLAVLHSLFHEDWPSDTEADLWDMIETYLIMYCCAARYFGEVGRRADSDRWDSVRKQFAKLNQATKETVAKHGPVRAALREFIKTEDYQAAARLSRQLCVRAFFTTGWGLDCIKYLVSKVGGSLEGVAGETFEDAWKDATGIDWQPFFDSLKRRTDLHQILDILGALPCGEIFDILNAALYLHEGEPEKAKQTLLIGLFFFGGPQFIGALFRASPGSFPAGMRPEDVDEGVLIKIADDIELGKIEQVLENPWFVAYLRRVCNAEGHTSGQVVDFAKLIRDRADELARNRRNLEKALRGELRWRREDWQREDLKRQLQPVRTGQKLTEEEAEYAARTGKPYPGAEAHHIVPYKHGNDDAVRLREVFNKLGISPNDPSNGVWLPGRATPDDPSIPAIEHALLHSEDVQAAYYKAVWDRIRRRLPRSRSLDPDARVDRIDELDYFERDKLANRIRAELERIGDELAAGKEIWKRQPQ